MQAGKPIQESEYKDVLISLFKSCKDTASTAIGIDRLFALIRTGEGFKAIIEEIRATTDANKRSELKKRLPGVTLSGLCDKGRKKENLIFYSGLMQIDLDKVENIAEVRAKLKEDKYVFAVFLSPSGTGLKVIVRVSNDFTKHLQSFLALEKYFLQKYKLPIDKSCKDITHLMFLSWDENLFANEKSIIFFPVNSFDEKIFEIVFNNLNKIENFTEGKRNIFVLKLASRCSQAGISHFYTEKKCLEKFTENDFSEDEIKKTVNNAFKNPENSPKNKLVNKIENEFPTLFKGKTANEWIKDAESQPIPNMLFGELWHEGELCILFADTNVGKSILAVQIADAISKGESNQIFKVEGGKKKILYFDFELSAKQFQNRYSLNYEKPYEFDANFRRLEIDNDFTDIDNFEETLFQSIENEILEQSAKILIIDNITFLKTQSTEMAKEALPLMKMLISLKKKYNVSILALAHTPKRDQSKPIIVNDVAGSKHFSNFADSIFSIGQSSKDSRIRYIKQIKARATEIKYHSDNVIECEVDKLFNFLGFNFIGFANERAHLKELSEKEKGELENQIIQLYTENPNLSFNEIAVQLGTYGKKVNRIISKYNLKE